MRAASNEWRVPRLPRSSRLRVREPTLVANTILCCNFIDNSLGIRGPMARKCSSPGCAFSLPDKYPLDKCPWHLAPGKGPVKIAAAITIAAAGFGGGIAYKKFRAYLRDRDKKRDTKRKKHASTPEQQQTASAAAKPSAPKAQKQKRTRKRTATRSKAKSPAKAATS